MSKYGIIKEHRRANNSCLEHFYTITYHTFLHILLCSTTYQKLVFYAGIPLKCKVLTVIELKLLEGNVLQKEAFLVPC